MLNLNKDSAAAILLVSTIIVSGCINGGGGSEDVDEGVTAIDLVELDVSPSQIYSGEQVQATMVLENTGNTEATINIDREDGEIKGRSVLESYCPDLFEITSFQAETDRVDGQPQSSYELLPEEQIRMDWSLRQFDEDRIDFYRDSGCTLSFTAPFEYSVEAFQQFQVRDNDQLEPGTIESRSSRGPMLLEINMIGSSSQYSEPYFHQQDFDPEHGGVEARIQLINQIPEDGEHGIVDAEPPELELIGGDFADVPNMDLDEDIDFGDGDEETRCGDPGNIYLYGGDSTEIVCDLGVYVEDDNDLDFLTGRTSISEIRASADYEYNAPMGERTISIDFRGGN